MDRYVTQMAIRNMKNIAFLDYIIWSTIFQAELKFFLNNLFFFNVLYHIKYLLCLLLLGTFVLTIYTEIEILIDHQSAHMLH